MTLWYPDFCPSAPGCVIETNSDQSDYKSFLRVCDRHLVIRDSLGFKKLFEEIRSGTSLKERMRQAMAIHFKLMKEMEDGTEQPSSSLVPVVIWPVVEKALREAPEVNPLPKAPFVLCEPDGGMTAVTGVKGMELDKLLSLIQAEVAKDPWAMLARPRRLRALTDIPLDELRRRL